MFTYTRRVRFAECTLGNHVLYSRYLDMIEEARGEFFRTAVGKSFVELIREGWMFPVTSFQIEYKRPARYDDVLSIDVDLRRVTRLKLHVSYLLKIQPDTLCAKAEIFYYSAGLDEMPQRMPMELAETMQKLVELPQALG